MVSSRGNSFDCLSSNSMANHYRHFRPDAALVFLHVVIAVLLNSIANAQNGETAREDSSSYPILLECVDLYIDPTMITDVQYVLGLDDNQVPLIQVKLEAYFTKLQKYSDELNERIYEAGFAKIKELNEAAKYVGYKHDQEEWDFYWHAWLKERAEGLKKSDLLMEEFLFGLQEVINDQQIEKLPNLRYRIWRKSSQRADNHPRVVRSDFRSYAIDVTQLTLEYMEDEVWLLIEYDPDIRLLLMSEIGDHLAVYDQQYHHAVKGKYAEARRIPRPDVTQEELDGQDELVARRRSLHRVTNDTVQLVARVLADHLGKKHEQQYLSRYHTLLCPSIFKVRMVDRISEWLVDYHKVIPPENIEAIELVIEQYLIRRTDLRNKAMRLGLLAKRKYIVATGNESEQQVYEDALYRLRLLTIDSVRTILVMLPDQRVAEELKAKSEAGNRDDPTLMGPLHSVKAEKRLKTKFKR